VGLTATPVEARPSEGADLCCALDVPDDDLKRRRSWTDSGGRLVNRATVKRFHELVVDRVRLDHINGMVSLAQVELLFDPFIGRRPDGTFDKKQIEVHNMYLFDAQAQVSMGEGQRKDASKAITSAFETMVQCAFCPVLGSVGCAEYKLSPDLRKLSLEQPSQAQRLLWRTIRDRQQKGHGRVVVFSVSAEMLQIARRACRKWGGCGKLLLFTGQLKTPEQRAAVVKRFLCPDNPRAVLFMSQAAATGITLCPGADTLIVFGDLPWNWSSLHQVIGRLHRCSQDRPVEVVKLVPRRGIMQCKLDAQLDKKDRLMKAIVDEDYANYTHAQPEQWRLRCEMALSMAKLDQNGNYEGNALMRAAEEQWEKSCQAAAAQNLQPPPYPDVCRLQRPELADDIVLPPCSFPVEGYVEATVSDDESSSSDSAPRPRKKRRVRSEEDRARAQAAIDNAKTNRSLVVEDDSSSEAELSSSEEESDSGSEESDSETGSSSSKHEPSASDSERGRGKTRPRSESSDEEDGGLSGFGEVLED